MLLQIVEILVVENLVKYQIVVPRTELTCLTHTVLVSAVLCIDLPHAVWVDPVVSGEVAEEMVVVRGINPHMGTAPGGEPEIAGQMVIVPGFDPH